MVCGFATTFFIRGARLMGRFVTLFCENVISETMVKKLSLKTEKHPHLYKLSWLQKGKSVHVDQRCLVHFSIRDKYRDKVLLLGRPWQFDRRTIHDGMRNTYSFDKDG
ncbi:hypothetical protein Tco_0495256, partial [Tanacetum coccineum]